MGPKVGGSFLPSLPHVVGICGGPASLGGWEPILHLFAQWPAQDQAQGSRESGVLILSWCCRAEEPTGLGRHGDLVEGACRVSQGLDCSGKTSGRKRISVESRRFPETEIGEEDSQGK